LPSFLLSPNELRRWSAAERLMKKFRRTDLIVLEMGWG
jgi:hypothetical protein